MPRTTRDDEPGVEPPPTEASAELAEASLTPPPAGRARRTERAEQPLTHCTEAELLGVMSMQHFDSDAARDAWSEMQERRAIGKLVLRPHPD